MSDKFELETGLQDNIDDPDIANVNEDVVGSQKIEETTSDFTQSKKESVDSLFGKQKKSADILNRSLILGVIIVVFLVIFLISFFVMEKNGKQSKQKAEIEQAYKSTYIPDFDSLAKQAEKNRPVNIIEPEPLSEDDLTDDELIASVDSKLPSSEELGVAPVYETQPGQVNGATGKVRPDTRDNPIQKTIQGIKGLTPTGRQVNSKNQGNNNYNTNNNNYSNNQFNAYNQLPSKEEMVQQLLAKQGLQGGFSNGNTITDKFAEQMNFYTKNTEGQSEQGVFLNPYSLWKGTVIPAVLVTGIDTGTPGNVVARVTTNIYSSLDGKNLLIPQGTLLFAEYNSAIEYAQKRIQVGWSDLIRPDGFFLKIGNMPGIDAEGYSGYKGSVNNHTWEFFKGLLLVSAISILDTDIAQNATKIKDPYTQGLIANTKDSYDSIRDKIMDRALNIEPTIRIKSGRQLNILLNDNIILPPVETPQVRQRYIRNK